MSEIPKQRTRYFKIPKDEIYDTSNSQRDVFLYMLFDQKNPSIDISFYIST